MMGFERLKFYYGFKPAFDYNNKRTLIEKVERKNEESF